MAVDTRKPLQMARLSPIPPGRRPVPLRRARPSPWIRHTPAPRLLLAVAIAALLTASLWGCSGAEPGATSHDGNVDVGTTRQAIYSGTVDTDASESPGVVSLRIGNGSSFELCSGSLLAPNVVLTARHCVSKAVTPTVSCNEQGQSGNGDHVGADEALDALHVYAGAKPKFGGAPSANVRTIVHPDGGILCNADIALLVLDRNIIDAAPLHVRLTAAPQPGETVRAVGYGQNDESLPVGTRLRKDAVPVLAIGRRVSSSRTPLGSHEFEVGKSICQGDSGGPAISERTGAVIGVVSRGGDCTDDFGHIYTTTSGFPELFAKAFALAGASPLDETIDPATLAAPTNTEPSPTARAGGCAIGAGRKGDEDEKGTVAWLAAMAGMTGLVMWARRRRRET